MRLSRASPLVLASSLKALLIFSSITPPLPPPPLIPAANTAIMCAEYHGMDVDVKAAFEKANFAFTAIFAFEMCFKIVFEGLRGYLGIAWHRFDCVVVVASLLDIGLRSSSFQSSSLNVLRSVRVIRMFRLARTWKRLGNLLTVVANSVRPIFYVAVILILFLLIFALVGMQLFGAREERGGQTGVSRQRPTQHRADSRSPPRFAHLPTQATAASRACTRASPGRRPSARPGSHSWTAPKCTTATRRAQPRRTVRAARHFRRTPLPPTPTATRDERPSHLPPSPDAAGTWVTYENGFFGGAVDGVNTEGFPYFDGARYALGGLCRAYFADGGSSDGGGTGASPAPSAYLVDLGMSYHALGHFDDMFTAMMSVFRVLTFDNWTDMLFTSMRATAPAAALYYVALIFIGDYYLLSLFLSILLSSFATENSKQRKAERAEAKEKKRTRRVSAAGIVGTVMRRAVTGARRAHVTGSRLLSSFRQDDPMLESMMFGVKGERSMRGAILHAEHSFIMQGGDSQKPVRAIPRVFTSRLCSFHHGCRVPASLLLLQCQEALITFLPIATPLATKPNSCRCQGLTAAATLRTTPAVTAPTGPTAASPGAPASRPAVAACPRLRRSTRAAGPAPSLGRPCAPPAARAPLTTTARGASPGLSPSRAPPAAAAAPAATRPPSSPGRPRSSAGRLPALRPWRTTRQPRSSRARRARPSPPPWARRRSCSSQGPRPRAPTPPGATSSSE